MWSAHIDERRQQSKHVQFGLACSTGQKVASSGRSTQSHADYWRPDIAKESQVTKIALNKGYAEPQQSLLAAHRSSFSNASVELSPLESSLGVPGQDQLDKPSDLNTRFAQMVEQPHPDSHARSARRYTLKSKDSELARAGRFSQAASLASDHQTSHRRVPMLHGPTGAPGQLQPPKRIQDMFRTKRPSNSDLPRTNKKACVRPTLSTALCTTPFAQELSARKHDFYSVSSQMVSSFDAPYQLPGGPSQENVASRDLMMKADHTIFCDDDTSDMMPCGMAPMPYSPTCNSEPLGFTAGLQMAGSGSFTPDCTQLSGRNRLAVSPSVHTPPECMAVVHDQPPGAPRKRSKSSSSSMSADSFDACESVFAPGAPDWSPRTAVCRVLKFDDEMDE